MNAVQFLALLLVLPAIWARASYDGYRAYRVTVGDEDQYNFLKDMVESVDGRFDVWKEARRHGDHMDVMVKPDDVTYFTNSLQHGGIEYSDMIDNVGALFDTRREQRELRDPTIYYDFTQYHTLAEIDRFLDELQTNFSSLVTLFTVGTSYEGRTIRGAKLSTGGTGKPAIWIDSCIHAREWIACATTQYFIYKLLNSYSTDPTIADLLDTMDIYYLPVVNVDGYEFTWTDDRMWRKTRSPNPGSSCVGSDPNRNWDFFWCERGSSKYQCSNSYCGGTPFSEAEVSSTAAYIESIPNLQVYMSFHAYGQWYMTTWAHYSAVPDNYDEQMTVCQNAINALMNQNGNTAKFECGTIQSFVGRTSGSSVDYIYKTMASVKYSFGIELRDQGRYGFELPPDQIIPSGEENYAAIVNILEHIRSINP